jgi:hypothetical protein
MEMVIGDVSDLIPCNKCGIDVAVHRVDTSKATYPGVFNEVKTIGARRVIGNGQVVRDSDRKIEG